MPIITKTFLNALTTPTGRRQYIWDQQMPGFGIVQIPNGHISFVARYRVGSGRGAQQRTKILGKYPAVTPDQARRLASEFKADAIRGVDKAAELARPRTDTVAELCERYIAEHGLKKRLSSLAEDQRRIDRIIVPRFGAKRVDIISSEDISALHASMSKTPFEANRILALLSKIFSLAVNIWKLRPDHPVKGIERYPEPARERYLTDEETRNLCVVLEQVRLEMPEAIRMIELLAVTGARKSEILGATWSQFDLERGVWIKPSAKTKQKAIHRVPLSDEALYLLREMHRERDKRRDTLFLNSMQGRLTAIKRAWKRIRKEAKIPDCRIHDLRHNFASIIISGGSSLPVLGALMGHTQPSTTARYAHLADAAQRKALAQAQFEQFLPR